MDFNEFKLGDMIEFKRVSSSSSSSLINIGIFLGIKNDLTPSSMSNYMRLHMLELGGKIFSVICWTEKDKITKLVSISPQLK